MTEVSQVKMANILMIGEDGLVLGGEEDGTPHDHPFLNKQLLLSGRVEALGLFIITWRLTMGTIDGQVSLGMICRIEGMNTGTRPPTPGEIDVLSRSWHIRREKRGLDGGIALDRSDAGCHLEPVGWPSCAGKLQITMTPMSRNGRFTDVRQADNHDGLALDLQCR